MIDYPILIKNAVPLDLCKFVSLEFTLLGRATAAIDPAMGQEPGFKDSFCAYCPPCLESLAVYMTPFIEETLNKELWPSYSYGRLYKPGSELNKHYDRRSSEYVISVCLQEGTKEWDLVVDTPDGPKSFLMNVGDLVLYSGRKWPHWRNGPYQGTDQIQAFIQYVDKNGDSADLKWDSRPALCLPFEFTQDYVKQELNQ
jgi:hypothetical protein